MKSLPLESFLFQSKSRLSPALTYTLEIGTLLRHLDVFRWEDRLVAHEEESDLWWCTFDAGGRRDAHEFWQECMANERVGRLYSVERAFLRSHSSGATLALGPYSLYVVVAQDNSGMACVHEEKSWYYFPAAEVRGIRKPLATRPTIWSRRFHPKFALRSLGAIGAKLEADALARAPEPIGELWSQGTGALSIQLVAAALAFGWANSLRGRLTLTAPQFWQAALSSRPPFSAASKELFELPGGLLRSPEVALPGRLIIPAFAHPNGQPPPAFLWQKSKVTLRIEFRSWNESAHELMEHRLELRDWLAQFFSPDEVESLFSS